MADSIPIGADLFLGPGKRVVGKYFDFAGFYGRSERI
jgi:hypothetical protein